MKMHTQEDFERLLRELSFVLYGIGYYNHAEGVLHCDSVEKLADFFQEFKQPI
jgi:hypothetical protein